jgi:hypothetical protein
MRAIFTGMLHERRSKERHLSFASVCSRRRRQNMSSVEKKIERILEIDTDIANALESLAVNWKRQIVELVGITEQKPAAPAAITWDPDKVSWQQAQGSSGLYERSEDVNSLDFKEMLKDLAAHQGKLTRDGYFYWTFTNGSTVGRKKKSKA